MSILYDFRLKLGRYKLSKDLQKYKRNREAKGLESSVYAGILFTPTDQHVFEQIKLFMDYLADYKIKTSVLGYVDSKIIPENFLFRKDIELFSQNDLNWNITPNQAQVLNFMEKPFDLLFDLSTVEYFPMEYVACLSKAKCKISRITDRYKSFDLMFDIDKGLPLEIYLENIKAYLNLINKPKDVKEPPKPTSSTWTLF